MSLGKSKAPDTPDYTGAAEKTAAGNVAAINAQTAANRVNQYTPWGNLTYSQTGTDSKGNPTWSQYLNLSPTQQSLLDTSNQTSLGLANLQGAALGQASNAIESNPYDSSQLVKSPIDPGQTAQDAIMSRIQPQTDMENKQFEQQMANQGIAPGSEAYMNAHRAVEQQQNDRYQQAALAGIDEGYKANNQTMQQQNFYATSPLNYLNAIRTGSQVTQPNFNGYSSAGAASGPNYLGAAQSQYQSALNNANMKNSSSSNFLGGLMNLGGSLGSAWLMG